MDTTLDRFEMMLRAAFQQDEHVKAWRWQLYSRHHCHVDRLGRAWDARGNRLEQPPRTG